MRRMVVWTLLLLLLALVGAGAYLAQALYQPLKHDEKVLAIIVAPNETPGQVIARLEAGGHIAHGKALRAWLRLRGGMVLKVGEYEVPAGTPAVDVLLRLASGRTVQRAFTLVEGWSLKQVRAALAAEPRIRQTLGSAGDAALAKQLGIDGSPEGWFAPDTYHFSPGVTRDVDLLKRALAEQRRRLDAAWNDRAGDLPYASAYELLTMASIVEKETGQASERPDIAGVFVRRMKIGMKLQTDPTVIYGLGDSYRGNITRAHLLQPTPWNTYVIKGLPPTPIAMPGRAAIEAAAHPAPGKALYFVGRGDGSHQFSETFEQHNAAVREYQLRRRADYRSAPKP
ncbi:MAG: endolytic transglycosylase MltG [Gammaproteobacteria bacterium]